MLMKIFVTIINCVIIVGVTLVVGLLTACLLILPLEKKESEKQFVKCVKNEECLQYIIKNDKMPSYELIDHFTKNNVSEK